MTYKSEMKQLREVLRYAQLQVRLGVNSLTRAKKMARDAGANMRRVQREYKNAK